MLKLPPKYSSGEYNNSYVDLFQDELRIYDEKIKRVDPLVIESIPAVKKHFSKNKQVLKRFKKLTTKKSFNDASDLEVLSSVFEEPSKYTDEIIDINYFSQYIVDIGFRFSLDMVLNCDPHSMFVAICSVNSPDSLYQDEVGYEKVIVYSEINFSSHVRCQKFLESFYTFVNVPPNEKTHMIVDIKQIKFKENEPTEVNDYAWTIFPIFTHLETDDDENTKELYVRSGLHMMPLFEGEVRGDLIQSLLNSDDPWTHMMDQKEMKVAPMSLLPKAGVVVRCIDNQREKQYSQLADWTRINYSFCPNNGSGYEYNKKTIKSFNKGNKLESLVPKDKTLGAVKEEIKALIRDKYGV